MSHKHLIARATIHYISALGFACHAFVRQHREFAETCFATWSGVFEAPPGLSLLCHASGAPSCRLFPRQIVKRTTGVPPVRSKLTSRREKRASPDAVTQQHRDVLFRFLTFLFETRSLVGNAIASRQSSGYVLQPTLRGWRAASRRYKVGCAMNASLPRVVASRHSSSRSYGTGSQRVEKSHPEQNEQSISAGRMGSFVSGRDRKTTPINGLISSAGGWDIWSRVVCWFF